MTKKIFDIEIKGAYEKYKKESKKKEVVVKPEVSEVDLEKTVDFFGMDLERNDYDAITNLYKSIYGDTQFKLNLQINYQKGQIRIDDNRITGLGINGPGKEKLIGLERLTEIRYLSLDKFCLRSNITNYLLNLSKIKQLENLKRLDITTDGISIRLKDVIKRLKQKGVDVHHEVK